MFNHLCRGAFCNMEIHLTGADISKFQLFAFQHLLSSQTGTERLILLKILRTFDCL